MIKFQTGKIAKAASFLGREDIVKEVETYLSMGQSVVLIAPRRFGKSSIINKILEDNKNRYKILSIDLMGIYSKRDFAEHIINNIYASIGIYGIIAKLKDISIEFFKDITNHLTSLKLSIEDISIETTGKFLKQTDEDKLLSYALELPEQIAVKLKHKYLFVIDELGEIDKFQSKNELLEKMRTIFQNQENIVFLFAGSQYALMTKIFTHKSSAFYKFAVPIDVPTMKASDFQELFKSVFYSNNISIPKDFAKDIEKISQGIPYYMVRIAQQVLIDAKLKDQINTYCYSIRAASLKVYTKEVSYFASELSKLRGRKYDFTILKALSQNINHTKALAELGVSRQNANTIINSLISIGLVQKRERYRIIDPFMQRYIKKLV
ncbi:MAG: hypothetical protein GQ570_13670 [Helicobacteraceae bacterium]|nr:hypothetical protein [Helicobacteraceae bacterium]